MKVEFNKYEKFDKFLNHEMSADEIGAFEKELSEDKELAAEFELYRELESFLSEDSDVKKLRKKLGDIQNNMSDD